MVSIAWVEFIFVVGSFNWLVFLDLVGFCFGWFQVVLVSATLPHEILEMTNKFMTDPVRILVKRDELTLEVRPSSSYPSYYCPYIPTRPSSLKQLLR